MPAHPAHHPALLAAYLAQFDLTTDREQEPRARPGYADLPDTDRSRRHQDTLTDTDVEELEAMRRRYGFPLR